ncbi:reprolysin-like metallopeptidase [Flavobacterium sp.]|uniref:zinc-dependent metalloprotease n=1 Tax=Flavobacterium sp. TaxID=239 RepID=UPI00262CF4DA|nr:zinc-dependent metalloprotease family protein [Flavobacterium sp.]MDD2987179.1 zinc-dependent metalloprotease family protein [Flavobacterium sp.]
MKKILFVFLLIFFSQLNAQQDSYWNLISNTATLSKNKNVLRETFPDHFLLFELNRISFSAQIEQAPTRFTAQKGVFLTLPLADGTIEEFEVFEASNFAKGLQDSYPSIRSYVGIGKQNKTSVARISVDPSGIQVMISKAGQKTVFLEPFSGDGMIYAVYTSSRKKGKLPFTCSTEDQALVLNLNKEAQQAQSSSGELLIFRLALSCNGEYTQYFGGTVAGALAAMNATMTRVNGVFEKDFGIHMDIIPTNENVIFTNPATDPYTGMGSWNNQLQTTLTNIIGEANYDVGHMFGASGGGGNAGCIGCVCVDGQKGRGITSPSDGIPAGDNFDIDYVAHELGHQFGANHTFSHNIEGTGVNVEPGSASTIMGYAGITSRDVQQHSDDYFVYASIKQVQDNMVGKTCPVRIPNGKPIPVTDAGPDYTIPKSTPFVLTGSATNPNADALTYCWEQNDTATNGQTGANSAASATKTIGPNWRSYDPVAEPVRYFPPLSRVVANQSTTQGLEIVVEALSSVARTLNFVLTTRDNFVGAGQTSSDVTQITVNATAGPFVVSAPNTSLTWQAGTNQVVTWDVAGTTGNGVNANYVDIYLSTDGGFTYPFLLASQVPNDGSETVTVPNQLGSTNRIMVKGHNHVFYDISNTNFVISSPSSTFAVAFEGVAGGQNKAGCTGGEVSYTIPYATLQGFAGVTNFSVSGEPVGTTVTISPSSLSSTGNVVVTISNTDNAAPGFYSLIFTAISGSETKTVPLYYELFDANLNGVSLLTPTNLATAQSVNPTLTWSAIPNATAYDVQVSTDVDFNTIIASASVITPSYTVTGLAEATDYYWRILAKNSACSGVFTAAFTFGTGQVVCASNVATNVPITIPTTGNTTVNSTLTVTDNATLSDVNVTLNIAHTWVNDITVTLISPAGTQVQLVANPCTSANLRNIQATFDDAGNTVVCAVNPAISGTVKPFQPLSAFNGESSEGIWTLRVLDSYSQDGGTINGWTLNLCSTQQPLAVSTYSSPDFMVYPNPNKGTFNLRYKSASSNSIAVTVVDMRGRFVYAQSFENNGLLEESISLNAVQTGVYMMSVVDGNRKSVQRIIIE